MLYGLAHRQSEPRAILVILPTWVGDFVMATPALRAIRTRFTEAQILFLMEANLRELVRGGDWMNECLEWPTSSARNLGSKSCRELVLELRRRRFDWAVLFPNSFRSALLARLIGARRRIGYGRDGRSFLLTDALPVRNVQKAGGSRGNSSTAYHRAGESGVGERFDGEIDRSSIGDASPRGLHPYGSLFPPAPPGRYVPMPIVDYYGDLAEALGCPRPDDALELFTTQDCDESVGARLRGLGEADHRPLVALSPGAKYGAAKCWPPERYAAVADRLVAETGAQILITCGPGEQAVARQIGSLMRSTGHVLDAPLLSLGELKSLIRRCDLLVCNDAGPRHIAKAFDVPVVTVFGPTHPGWTSTRRHAERVVRVDVDCGPCQQRVCPLGHIKCMTGVSVEMVFGAACELLAAGCSRSAR